MFKIGNIEIKGKAVLAPMAGITNVAYRKLCQDMGACLTYTEMTSNVGLAHNSQKTFEIGKVVPEEKVVALQIFGGNIEEYVESAKYWSKNSKASIIDINMGCPVPKVALKSQAGSALLKTPEHVGKICKAIVEAIDKPLTIKIRIGWNDKNLTHVKVAQIAQKAGVKAIAVHGRTREQMYRGKSDWDAIKQVKESVSIPIIGNGDITSPEIAQAFLEYTKVDAVMIARQARDNPWIFKQINSYLQTGSYQNLPNLKEVLDKLLYFYFELKKIKAAKVAFLEVKGTANNWLKRFKEIKNWKQELITLKNEEEFLKKINTKIACL